jgi:hypothetical protein
MNRFFFTFSLYLLSTFTLTATADIARADPFPLAFGNFWVYRDAVTGQSIEVRVHTPFALNDHIYYAVSGFGPRQLLLRINESGNLAMWDEERNQELLVTAFETGANIAAFEAYGRQCPATGRTQKDPVDYKGPAGEWKTIEIQYLPYGCADAGETAENYVDNIGMVRRVVETIAGPRTFDLIHARVGRQVIAAGEVGRFTITASPGMDGASWDVTLRVDPMFGSSLPLRFSSSQEYDLRLRARDGQVLWVWSANKLFAQAEHSVQDIGGWTDTLSVPHPPAVPEGPHSYVLEAWLTPAMGQPQFAAATTLDLAAKPAAARVARRR